MAALRLEKRRRGGMMGKMGEPEDFSGGGTTNLADPKFDMKPGVTSDDLGTIGPNKATKFIQEYASKITEVNADTMKASGEMTPGEGIVGIECVILIDVAAENSLVGDTIALAQSSFRPVKPTE